jgi:hypothetical protein
MSAMTGTARVLRYAAVTLMTLFGLLGGMFAAAYAFEDLGPWAALGSTSAVAVPTTVLSVVAFRSPERAAPWFVALTGAVGLFTLLDAGLRAVDANLVGPVVAIGVFALAVSLGFLGLHRPALAGLLLVLLGAAQFGAVVLRFSGELAGGGAPGLGNMLATSSGVIVVPLLGVGILFLVAGALTHDTPRLWHPRPTTHPAH